MRLLIVLFLWLALCRFVSADEPNALPTNVGFNDPLKMPDHALFEFMAREFHWRLKEFNDTPISADSGEMMVEFGHETMQLKTRCHQLSGTWHATGAMLQWTLLQDAPAFATECMESARESAVIKEFRSGHFQATVVHNVRLMLTSQDGAQMRFNAVNRSATNVP